MSIPPIPSSDGQAADGQPASRRLVFTSSQAAVYLGVSLATIRRWTDAGHISCYRTPGGQRRFSRDQLDTFTESLRRDGSDEKVHRQRSALGGPTQAIVA